MNPPVRRPLTWSRWTWDRVLVPLLFLIISVFSVTQTIGIRELQQSQKSLDLVTQCTTPGSRCYKLTQEAAVRRAQDLKLALEDAAICAIETAPLPAADRRPAFKQCVTDAATARGAIL
jgi:hypothetical protein